MINLAQFIIQIESFNANVNIPLIRKAYEFSDRSHAGQKRDSGEPYVTHCLEVAFILAEQHLDSTTIAAGLIHDVVEDTAVTIKDIRKEGNVNYTWNVAVNSNIVGQISIDAFDTQLIPNEFDAVFVDMDNMIQLFTEFFI